MSTQAVDRHRPSTLLIGSEALLAAWNKYAARAPQVVALVHTDVQRAMDMIELTAPQVVVLEQTVAASAIGSALIVRVHNERSWRGTEIRLLKPEQAAAVMDGEPGNVHPQDWLGVLAHPLPPRPERSASRIPANGSEHMLIDGNVVTLVDWSATGAQVHSSTVLRPHTRVRIKLSIAQTSTKTTGVVVWSAFEIQPVNRYRVGIAFAEPIAGVSRVPATPSADVVTRENRAGSPSHRERAGRKSRRPVGRRV